MTFQNLHPDSLYPNPDQPRKHFDADALAELAASIRQNGLMQPIVARPAECPHHGPGSVGHVEPCYMIVAGERRWRACRMAGLDSVPVNVLTIDEEQTLVLAITENVTRADMTEMEIARAYDRLRAMGYTPERIAEVFGKGVDWIHGSLALLNLTAELQWLVERGHMSKNVGVAISRLDVEAQKDTLRRINAGEFQTNDAILRHCTVVQKAQDQPGLFGGLMDADPIADARRARTRSEIERVRAKLAGMAPALGALMELTPEALAEVMDERLEAELDALVKCVTRARGNVRQAQAIRKVVAA